MANKRFMTVQTAIPDSYQIMKKLGVEKDGDVQDKLTDLVMDNLKDFMPRESGELIAKMRKLRKDRIRVEGPYARFLFFGVTSKGEPVKYANANPKGGAHWDRRMVAERGSAIVAQLRRYVRSRK
jgi:hypothetical protein